MEEKKSAAFASVLNPKTPLLLDCPVSIECSVTGSVLTGSHEMFIGKIEYVHADASLVDGEGKIDWKAIDFLRL